MSRKDGIMDKRHSSLRPGGPRPTKETDRELRRMMAELGSSMERVLTLGEPFLALMEVTDAGALERGIINPADRQ